MGWLSSKKNKIKNNINKDTSDTRISLSYGPRSPIIYSSYNLFYKYTVTPPFTSTMQAYTDVDRLLRANRRTPPILDAVNILALYTHLNSADRLMAFVRHHAFHQPEEGLSVVVKNVTDCVQLLLQHEVPFENIFSAAKDTNRCLTTQLSYNVRQYYNYNLEASEEGRNIEEDNLSHTLVTPSVFRNYTHTSLLSIAPSRKTIDRMLQVFGDTPLQYDNEMDSVILPFSRTVTNGEDQIADALNLCCGFTTNLGLLDTLTRMQIIDKHRIRHHIGGIYGLLFSYGFLIEVADSLSPVFMKDIVHFRALLQWGLDVDTETYETNGVLSMEKYSKVYLTEDSQFELAQSTRTTEPINVATPALKHKVDPVDERDGIVYHRVNTETVDSDSDVEFEALIEDPISDTDDENNTDSLSDSDNETWTPPSPSPLIRANTTANTTTTTTIHTTPQNRPIDAGTPTAPHRHVHSRPPIRRHRIRSRRRILLRISSPLPMQQPKLEFGCSFKHVKRHKMNTNIDTIQTMLKTSTDTLPDTVEELKNLLMCKVCNHRQANILLVECAHNCVCNICIGGIEKCCICRTKIENIITMFR